MTTVPWDYDAFLDAVVSWAGEREDLGAVVVVGSRGRGDGDAWSDLDLVLVTTAPGSYLESTAWLSELGDPWLTFREPTATGDRTERRALFGPGLDVDFVPLAPDELESAAAESDALARGYRVVHDEIGVGDRLAAAASDALSSPNLPSAETFRERCADFWYHAVWTAKKLRRGEVWTAKGCLDGYAKRECLLPMLSWHARARHDRDPWYDGRFLEAWADDRALADLRTAFARYDPEDCWRALFETMALFRWVAEETADERGFEYVGEADERATRLVEVLFEER